MMQNWTLLRTQPATQNRYLNDLHLFAPAIEIYFPQHSKLIRVHKSRKPQLLPRPLYPGYIFARPDFDAGEHRLLTRLPTRASFIRFGPEISFVPDDIILELKRLESLNQLMPGEPESPYQPGRRVRVIFPTTEIVATIISITHSKALIDSPLCQISVPIYRLQPLA